MKLIPKYQEGNPIEGLDAWEERERKRVLQLRNEPGLTPIYPEFDLLLGARGLINGAVKEGIKQVPRAAKYIYNAAKKLPYSKTAHNFMTGMIGGLTVDNLNKQLFGKSWGESVSEPVDYVVRKSGWNPDDTLWGRVLANIGTTAAEFTNPGYLLSPAGVKQIGETAYKGLLKLKPTFGYVRGGNTGGTKLYSGINPEIIGIGKNLPGSQEIEISPEDLYKILLLQDGYYFLGHGTGRTNVSPEEIFNSGLRIKGAEISNTTTPISESRLRAWPHLNSENIIILPGKADMVRYDFPYGQIPTDWYTPKIFSWNDNPKVIGRGLLARQEPNASFIFENDGAVYTKPEAILGAYNTKTHTLKLNPNSQYKFQFGETSVTPLITVENAAGITPEQWTAAQDAAIARGDMAEALRLRDLHFKVSAPDTKVKEAVFNGNRHSNTFYEFNTNFRAAPWGDYTTGAWFGNGDKNTMLAFAGDKPSRLRKFYLNFKKPFIKDANYRRWDKLLPFDMTEKDVALEAAKLREKGFPEYIIEDWKKGLTSTTDKYALKLETTDYDSGIIKNVYENKAHPDSEYGVLTDYIASKPNQIKLADAVTYGDDGVRIPLGERDNFNVNDIRYAIPTTVGGSALGTSLLYNYLDNYKKLQKYYEMYKQGGKLNNK